MDIEAGEVRRARMTRSSTKANSPRACVDCHRRKIRCDIALRGPPCTSCASHEKPDCRMFQRKRERLSAARSQQKKPSQLKPRRPDAPSISPQETTLPGSDDGRLEAKEGEDHDPGNLADFLGRGDVRNTVIDHGGRMCFIGTEMSNFNYLVRQSSLTSSEGNGFHFGNRQFLRKHTAHDLHQIPQHALERPEKRLADKLIRAYFENVNRGWPVIDEVDFMAQYEGKDPRFSVSLPLLNAVFLVGAFVLASKDETMKPLQSVFFRRVKTLVDYRFEQDRIVYVQVALLMTWYSDGLEEIVANAWYWIGVATRTALGMGMHRDATHSKMVTVHKRIWARLWWVLFQFDTIISASYGKPQGLNIEDSDVPELEPWHFEGIPSAEADFVLHHSRLCVIISRTMRERWALHSSAASKISASERADELLAEFMMQLPHSLHPSFPTLSVWQATLHLTYNNFVILLHRPPPQRTGPLDEVSQACSDAKVCGEANFMVTSTFDSLLKQGLLSKIWLYANHALFTALIHVANESKASNPIMVAKYHTMFDSLIESLRELAKHWRFAQGLLQLFEERSMRIKQARVQANNKTKDPTISTDLNRHLSDGGLSQLLQNQITHNSHSRNVGIDSQELSATEDQSSTLSPNELYPGEEPTEVAHGTLTTQTGFSQFGSGDFLELGATQAYGDQLFESLPFLDTNSFDFFLGEINMD